MQGPGTRLRGRLGGLSKWEVWGVDAGDGRSAGTRDPPAWGTMGVSRKPRCRNGGRRLAPWRIRDGRAPRPPPALSVPEMAQGNGAEKT